MRLYKIMNNFHTIYIGGYTLYFSYETLIGIIDGQDHNYVAKNEWGRTTAKHINWITTNKCKEAIAIPHYRLEEMANYLYEQG